MTQRTPVEIVDYEIAQCGRGHVRAMRNAIRTRERGARQDSIDAAERLVAWYEMRLVDLQRLRMFAERMTPLEAHMDRVERIRKVLQR